MFPFLSDSDMGGGGRCWREVPAAGAPPAL